MRRTRIGLLSSVFAVVALAASFSLPLDAGPVPFAATTTSRAPSEESSSAGASGDGDIVVVAAGDISTRTRNGGNETTSNLVLSLDPDVVLTLGDNQYTSGLLDDFRDYFDPTWGRFKSKIRPTPGHHEYYTDHTAAGYYTYFGGAASPQEPDCTSSCKGYYSFDLGNWHLLALNTNHDDCAYVRCGPSSAQVDWLRDDLAENMKPCVLAYWADPRWSSGIEHGNNPDLGAIWDALYDARADVVLNGHEHLYERFARQDPLGRRTAEGIREFTVGTGGNGNLYPFGPAVENSVVRDNSTLGVLQLTLSDDGYDWAFKPVPGGNFHDSGSATCH